MSNKPQPHFTIDRTLYDSANTDTSKFKTAPGLLSILFEKFLSRRVSRVGCLRNDSRLLNISSKQTLPTWGPDLSGLNLNEIIYFARPNTGESTSWDTVPEDIKKTFEKLGIPEAERNSLGGAGAQYDSDVVYHRIKDDLKAKGVIFENMDVAVQQYPDLVKEYFMTQCIPINDHKFIMLHAAVWSGGTFIYVPKNVKVDLPLQAYFRMNAEKGGQFEHTLIIVDEGAELHYIEGCSAPRYNASSLHAGGVEIFVKKGGRCRYSSIENWSKNTYNLNTKRALVDEDAVIEWVNGNMGSGTTMLYPASILRGRGARSDSLGVAFAGPGQNQDTGAKAIHVAPDTKSTIKAKSISVNGGITTYRGLVKVAKSAERSKVSVECDALLIGDDAISNTYPYMKINNSTTDIAHEARVGKIGDDEIFYLQSRGLSEEAAMNLVVSGFIEPVIKSLPLEYALELNKLIELEMEGSVG
jgi:Fe-S cluster assembly protein SufB